MPCVRQEMESLICLWCDKPEEAVRCLVAGPKADLFICDECIEVCNDIIADDGRRVASFTTPTAEDRAARVQYRFLSEIKQRAEELQRELEGIYKVCPELRP
jgi:ATP-dependent protease Clp ATPase subunit